MTARLAIISTAVAAACLAACGRGSYRPSEHPPFTRVERTTQTLHGVTVSDDYRWLEGRTSPAGTAPAAPPEVAAWTDAERQYTRRVLDGVPGRDAVASRLAALMDVGDVSLPLVSGNRYFFWLRNAGEPRPTVFMREGALGSDRAVLRPTDLDPDGLTAARWIMPSPDGRWLALGAAAPGARDGTLALLDVDAGAMAPLVIHGSPRAVYWLPDSSGFIYQRQDPADPSGTAVLFHRLGEDPARDLLVRRNTRPGRGAAAALPVPFVSLSRDGHWLIAGEWTSPDSNDLWLISFDAIRRHAPAPARAVTTGLPGRAVGTVVGDTLFIHTTKGAPNGRVVAADLSRPGSQYWRDVVPERADATITDVAFGSGLMAVTYLEHASNVTDVFDGTGRSLGRLAQPGIGMTSLTASEQGTSAFMLFQSYNRPPTVFRVDLQAPAAHAVQWKAPVVPLDPDTVGVERVRFRSRDGTEVSMFVARRRDVTPDGTLPTVLAGYGAFGATLTPSFTAHWIQWFEAGGVLAVAHVRGGGEYGPPWHADGARERKMNSFDDFIAAAEWLIAQHYTSPDRLAVYGGAAGGLLAGGALVMRPDLFRAGVLVSPILDMLRYDQFPPGAAWTPEFGAPADPAAFGWLSVYSPYQHVKPETPYPAVLLTGSEIDGGIDPMHVRKMAARLQASTSSEPAERPVLLWIEKASDPVSPEARALQALIDQRVFLMWQLGMTLPR